MPVPQRGEIWWVDLGMVAKVRPVLVLSVAYRDNERAVCTFIPRTTATRGTRFEVPHKAHGMIDGAFDAQGIATVPAIKFQRFQGEADSQSLVRVEAALAGWLGLRQNYTP